MTPKYCQHIYRSVGQDPCPFCGGDSHEVDWKLYMKQRAEHREKYGILYNVIGWWSI